jgi:hypothetical protein
MRNAPMALAVDCDSAAFLGLYKLIAKALFSAVYMVLGITFMPRLPTIRVRYQ